MVTPSIQNSWKSQRLREEISFIGQVELILENISIGQEMILQIGLKYISGTIDINKNISIWSCCRIHETQEIK